MGPMGGASKSRGGSETTPSQDENETTLSQDDCFDLLSNHRRRYALHYLRRNEGEASLGELADTVASLENGVDRDAVSYDQRKRVYTSLQQVHLPRMDEMDVVEFDEREGAVAIGPAAEDLDIYLEVVQGRDIPWSLFYLLLGVVNAVIVGAAALGTPVLAAIPTSGWSVFVVTTFLVTSLAHVYLTRTEMRLGEGDPPDSLE